MKCNFNPPAAPHFGGSRETLVKVHKDSFYNVNGSRTLDDKTSSTFACEVEAIMNSRPLTNVPSDLTDSETHTPNHFLLGRLSVNMQTWFVLAATYNKHGFMETGTALTQQFRLEQKETLVLDVFEKIRGQQKFYSSQDLWKLPQVKDARNMS